MVHRARQGFVEQRTATINRIRGLLSEFGIVLPLKAATVRREACAHLEDLPGWANTVIGDLLSEVTRLDERIAQYDQHIAPWRARRSPAPDATLGHRRDHGHRIMARSATATTSSAAASLRLAGPGARAVQLGRQDSAWGASPRPGDAYLRSLLVLGARAVLARPRTRPTRSAAGR
jgi:transposase